MNTDSTVTRLVYAPTISRGNMITKITASLDDDCKNGHADFSLTCDIKERINGRWQDAGGGCDHEHILKVTKGHEHEAMFKLMADLHLSDADGVPMYAPGNAFYWFCGMFADGLGYDYHGGSGRDGRSIEECRKIFAEHIRADEAQVAALLEACPMDAQEMSYFLEKMGFRAKWKAEATRAREWLESVCKQRFLYKATRETWPVLTPEQVAVIEERRRTGYHTAEQREERRLATVEKARVKKRREIEQAYQAKVDEAMIDRALALALVDCNAKGAENTIFYKHTKTVEANWATHRALWSRQDWDAFVAVAEQIPELANVTFKFNEKPKS